MIFRCDKGEPLTFLEMDQNFRELLERINDLEKRTAAVEEHALMQSSQKLFVIQEGGEIIFQDHQKRECGRAILPVFRPNLRGKWCAQEYYHLHDWIVFEGDTYGCVMAHVSLSFDNDKDYWRLVMEKNTN